MGEFSISPPGGQPTTGATQEKKVPMCKTTYMFFWKYQI